MMSTVQSNHPMKQLERKYIYLSIFTICLFFIYSTVYAAVRLPSGGYQERVVDMEVKIPGGQVSVTHAWEVDNVNRGSFRWYINPTWTDLRLVYDSLDGSVKEIYRAGGIYARQGSGVFLFDELYWIKQTAAPDPVGFRWFNAEGEWITYDNAGKITAFGNRYGLQAKFTRNADGKIHQVLDRNDQVILTYNYVGDNISNIQDSHGRSVSYTYNNNKITQATNVAGDTWSYGYDGGLLSTITDPEGQVTTVTYRYARVTRVTDSEGKQTNYTYSYDKVKRIYTTVEISPSGVRQETRYDARGRILSKQIGNRVVQSAVKDSKYVRIELNERGGQTRIVYDVNRQPLEIQYPDGTKITNTYTAKYNQLASHTDALGNQTVYQHDSMGNLVQVTQAVGKPEQRIITFQYNQVGECLSATLKGLIPPAGVTPDPSDTRYQDATFTWTYDAMGNMASATDPTGNTTHWTYDERGNVLTKKDALNHTTTYTYNDHDGLLTMTDPLNHTKSFTYDKLGRRLTVTDALNNTTSTTYNVNDLPVKITDPMGKMTTFSYNLNGRLTKITDADNNAVNYQYDSYERLAGITDANGNNIQFQYGTTSGFQGLLTSIVYPTFTENYRYDAMGRPTQITQVLPGQNGQLDQTQVTSIGYDAKGNVIAEVDALGRTTFTTYDALGRLQKITDALGNITQYAYGSRDQLLTFTDASGSAHQFAYDLSGRLLKETRPLGGSIQYSYDAVGNLLTRHSPKGDQRQFVYDALNRRIQEAFTLANTQTPAQTIDYTYNAGYLLTGYVQNGDTQSSASYSYNANKQKILETVIYGSGPTAISNTLHYSYTDNGRLKSLTYPDGRQTTYTYDHQHLATITTPDTTQIQLNQYQWQVPMQMLLPKVVRTLEVDPLQRPKTLQSQLLGTGTANAPNGNVLMNTGYTYNPTGDIIQRQTADGPYTYNYDALYRLIEATPPATLQKSQNNPNGLPVEMYGYDAVGNRISSQHQPGTWNYNANHQLLQWGLSPDQHTLTYDDNGHTIEEKIGDPNNPILTRMYTYNATERLAEIHTNGATTAQYQYDPFGRRIKKTINNQSTWYLYSDQGLIGEYNQNGTLVRAYGWKPDQLWGTDPLWLADIAPDPNNNNEPLWTMHYFHNDHLGTPQQLTDKDGNLTWKANYETFGNTRVDSASTINNPLRFAGQYFDPETNTHYNWQRDYLPEVGRYQQWDPIGLAGGVNMYAYAISNPVKYIDPFGLDIWIEGPSEDEPTGHQSINIGDPNGGYVSYSFGISLNCPGGCVYKDLFTRGPFEAYMTTSEEQDRLAIKFIEETKASDNEVVYGYNPLYGFNGGSGFNTCRSYSQDKFEKFLIMFNATPKKQLPSRLLPANRSSWLRKLLDNFFYGRMILSPFILE